MSKQERMTVQDLIDALQSCVTGGVVPADTLIGVAKDPEGNGFSLLTGPERLFGTGRIEAWGRGEAERAVDGKSVFVIWPGYPQFDLGDDE